MNTKKKGNRNEHKSKALLEAAGYAVCRAAASLGVWDLIGVGSTDVVLVQVKSNRPPCPAEMEGMKEFKIPSNCRKLLHIWKDYARMPIVKEIE